jgi:deazaflavin-dependent oxidoreductase (nitroreductase family)
MTNTKAVTDKEGDARGGQMIQTADDYNGKIIAEFRGNQGHVGGDWEEVPLLLLHHVGVKSAQPRVNPVAYLRDGSRYFIWAANGGAPQHPAWYHNLRMHPATNIEVGGETIDVVAEETTGEERERLYSMATDTYPQLAEAAARTERVIPIVVLAPR